MSAIQQEVVAAGILQIYRLWTTPLKCLGPGLSDQPGSLTSLSPDGNSRSSRSFLQHPCFCFFVLPKISASSQNSTASLPSPMGNCLQSPLTSLTFIFLESLCVVMYDPAFIYADHHQSDPLRWKQVWGSILSLCLLQSLSHSLV